MRDTLAKWISDADALHHVQRFGIVQPPLKLNYLLERSDDYYISLIGELFDRLHQPYKDPVDWSRLGNAIIQAAGIGDSVAIDTHGILSSEAALFAAASFYFGGYTASAYLTLKSIDPIGLNEVQLACYELMGRPSFIRSQNVRMLLYALRSGDLKSIKNQLEDSETQENLARNEGPEEWVGWRLFRQMLLRFQATNIRSVLPNGESQFWVPLVDSFLRRTPPVWDFFPSQIDAIKTGLLDSITSFSIQMPTGAGKTALSETLLFYHLNRNKSDVAILLVPYRSLAAELRGTLVKNLGQMGIPSRCAYGGTVPTGDEVRDLAQTRAIVATPEAISGLLSADPKFFSRVSLVICDEGHLLDGASRGVGLELLLARMRARENGPPKFVFVSAIVPNIEEINAWLGGSDETVVRSDYRPAIADFSMLRVNGSNSDTTVNLELHPHDKATAYSIERFLSRDDFRFRNPSTGRLNTFSFNTIKTQAIATARKALSMGAVAVFAANKHGNQGAVGLAEELLLQLSKPLPLPSPMQYVSDAAKLQSCIEYFILEYGSDWVGTQTLAAGAILHHGDIPQESREVLETLVRVGLSRLVICTSTLAEGVNLPIRTLVLYSVQRRRADGATENLLARDIKNLVGRAGRAGSTTKGLVICTNSQQWPLIEPVANQLPGERVEGYLVELMRKLQSDLINDHLALSNEVLECNPLYHTLIDGIDATLIDLAAEELGEDELVRIASELSNKTFASSQADSDTKILMRKVFELRARRVAVIKKEGQLGWIRETGTRVRLLDSVEKKLLTLRERWDDIDSPTDPILVETLLTWAWELPELKDAIRIAYDKRIPSLPEFLPLLNLWLLGLPIVDIASKIGLSIDTILGVHSRVISYALHVSIEQAIGLLNKLLESRGMSLAQAVIDFPDHLRFGVPSQEARILAAGGIRHRRAAMALAQSHDISAIPIKDRNIIFDVARQLILEKNEEFWLSKLGRLVLDNTIEDLRQAESK